MQKTVYLSLGSNLGDRRKNLENALEKLEQQNIRILSRSSIYETEPQDLASQPWFLNLAVECHTPHFPVQLLTILQAIERELGRASEGQTISKGPRVIDIDILLFGNAVIKMPRLTIPHPRMLDRRFVLEPLLEIAPHLKYPRAKQPLRKYLSKVRIQTVKKVG